MEQSLDSLLASYLLWTKVAVILQVAVLVVVLARRREEVLKLSVMVLVMVAMATALAIVAVLVDAKTQAGGPKLTVIQKSEQVILSFVQQIEKLGTAEGISVVLPKNSAALTEKIAGRLDSKLKAVYAEDWTPGTDFTRGMQVLSKLEVAHAASLKITAFSNCFHKKETSAETLLQSIVALQDESTCVDFAELRIDPRAYEEYAKRTCGHAAKEYDWASISLALSKNSKVVELYEQSLISKWNDSGSDFEHKKKLSSASFALLWSLSVSSQ